MASPNGGLWGLKERVERHVAEGAATNDESKAKKKQNDSLAAKASENAKSTGIVQEPASLTNDVSTAHKNVSMPDALDSSVHIPNNKADKAVMYLNDASAPLQQHSASSSWYEPYGTTLLLIVLLHLVFLRQWNSRKTKKDVMVSYRILVQKKHWYRCVPAVLSHPPADNAPSSMSSPRSTIAVSFGNEETTNDNTNDNSRRFLVLLKRAYTVIGSKVLHPLFCGHLSGLPLLTYNSHILWSCRALEATCTSHLEYARVLIGLTLVALLLELRLSHNVLGMNRAFVGMSNYSTTTIDTRRAVLNRSIGTSTMLTSALMVLYRGTFPFVAIKVLPFIPLTARLDPALAYGSCVVLLVALSWQSHPVTSVVCGTMSGLFWTAGFTSFLANAYWGLCLLVVMTIMCALSMRSRSIRLAAYVPCIDYVAWDHRGVIIRQAQGEEEQDDDDDGHDSDDQVSEDGDIESRPLLRSSSSHRHESGSPQDAIHGRLPLMDMDSTEMDSVQVPTGVPMGGPRGLSRRGGTGSSSHPVDGTPNNTSSSPSGR